MYRSIYLRLDEGDAARLDLLVSGGHLGKTTTEVLRNLVRREPVIGERVPRVPKTMVVPFGMSDEEARELVRKGK